VPPVDSGDAITPLPLLPHSLHQNIDCTIYLSYGFTRVQPHGMADRAVCGRSRSKRFLLQDVQSAHNLLQAQEARSGMNFQMIIDAKC
jgi:hypothetical protein